MCFFKKRRLRKEEEARKAEQARKDAELAERVAREKAAMEAEEKEREEAARKAEEERLAAIELQKSQIPAEKITKKTVKPRKAPAKKTTSSTKATKTVTKEEPAQEANATATTKKSAANNKSVYHVSKREEDGVWQIKYTGGRVIKLCKTKAEAMEYAKTMAANQDGTVIFHPSKGTNKGKFQKA